MHLWAVSEQDRSHFQIITIDVLMTVMPVMCYTDAF